MSYAIYGFPATSEIKYLTSTSYFALFLNHAAVGTLGVTMPVGAAYSSSKGILAVTFGQTLLAVCAV